MSVKKPVIICLDGGFYIFGYEVKGPDDFIALEEASMFGGFAGGKGLPGVARGDKDATVTLDKFPTHDNVVMPMSAVFAIFPSIDLYSFKGAMLR